MLRRAYRAKGVRGATYRVSGVLLPLGPASASAAILAAAAAATATATATTPLRFVDQFLVFLVASTCRGAERV